jgi:hypothetical protein
MKRSCAGDNSPIIKKKIRDNTDQEEETAINTTNITTIPSSTAAAPNTITNPTFDMSVLRYVHDLVHNLNQGDIDHCLSKSIDLTKFNETLSKPDLELLDALDSNLKKFAKRQLQLQTHILRSRIMIQQQHQLLTAYGHKEKVMNCHQTDDNHKEQDDDDGGGGGKLDTTPEDNLSSVLDTSLLEKLENSYLQMSKVVDPPTQGDYFSKVYFY